MTRAVFTGVLAALLAVCAAAGAADTAAGEALREAVFDAALAEDPARLAELVAEHREAIRHAYRDWIARQLTLAPDARARGEQALEAVAALYERGGDRTLRGMLSGVAARNRARGWGRALRSGARLAGQGDCAGAVSLLEPVAAEMRGWHGEAIDAIALRVDEVLGACHRAARAWDAALGAVYRGYERAVGIRDRAAIIAFGRQMAGIHRAAGEQARARDWASGTAGVMRAEGRAGEADALLEEYGVPGGSEAAP